MSCLRDSSTFTQNGNQFAGGISNCKQYSQTQCANHAGLEQNTISAKNSEGENIML